MKPFRPLLGCEVEDIKDLRYPLYGSPKYDGVRGLINAQGQLVSRQLKRIPSRVLRVMFEGKLLIGVEGELICGNPVAPDVMQKTVSAVMSEDKDELADKVKLYVFDYYLYPLHPFSKRFDMLTRIVDKAKQTGLAVALVQQRLLKSAQDASYYEQDMVDRGYEGVILRAPEGLYKYGRSTLREQLLMKVKRFKDGGAVILEVEELMSNQNKLEKSNLGYADRSTFQAGMVPAGILGSFTVRDIKSGVEFSIGGGPMLTKEERTRLWKIRNQLPGKLLKYRYQPAGVRDKPRFPTAVAFRDRRDM